MGETGLLISCAELILNRGHKIWGVISTERKVQDWAKKYNINYSASIEIMNNRSFDYLFSIANPNIIPKRYLDKASKCAINYHDSILPKYAGSNAPTWAILNGELEHGVTWHIIDTKVDSGDILKQANCKIDHNETTLSLNLKCFQLALDSFTQLLNSIEQDSIIRTPQRQKDRTFYFKNQKPENGGIINWNNTAEDIDRLCRALYFGYRQNNFAEAKIFIGSKLYIVHSHQVCPILDIYENQPGTILSLNDSSIEIAASQGSIVIHKLIDPDSPNKVLSQIIKEYSLIQGKQLNSFSASEITIGQTDIENIDDRGKIKAWNITDNNYFENKTVHQLFEEIAEKVPERIAVTFQNFHISYDELNKKANQLARHLLSLSSSSKQTIVGILMDRSIDMVISMLAILKGGMSYLPIDTFYPEARIKHMLTDAKTSLVITTTNLTHYIPQNVQLIFIDEIELQGQVTNLDSYDIHSLTYILYTSGSTGLPKGADLMHIGISNLLTWYRKEFNINAEDNILIFTAFGFDLTQKNILGGLISGANVKLYDSKLFDAEQIVQYIKRQNITFINCPPSAFYTIVDEGDAKSLAPLRIILLGGETIKTPQIRSFIDKNLKCVVVNTYGPTECSDLALTHNLSHAEIKGLRNIPLGRNVGNVSVFILDKNLNLAPVGEIGEIYIGGLGLARGYWTKPDHTARIFIANPFTDKEEFPNALGPGSRLYKTGDLGRYLPSGQVEFLGRADHQVKIRGYRIELGEIETVISCIEDIKQTVVLLHEYSGYKKGIIAYILPSLKSESLVERVRERCLKNLPEYMQPSQIILIDKIPLTPNGKIDRNALPKPNQQGKLEPCHKPKTEEEKILAEVLTELLNIANISITDNFFQLGGDSIIAIKLVALMKKRGYYLTISDLYILKTIQDIALHIRKDRGLVNAVYQPFSLAPQHNINDRASNIKDAYPASFLQKGMLVESLKDNRTYHDVFSYKINQAFDFQKFLEAWELLVNKHPVFKTSFLEDEKYTYLALEHVTIDLKSKIIINDIDDLNTIIDHEASSSFNFVDPGLFRFIIKLDQQSYYLIISFHHALLDGWSLATLINEFVDIYIDHQKLESVVSSSYGEFIRTEIQNAQNQTVLEAWKQELINFENCSNIITYSDEARLPYSLEHSFNNFQSLELIKYCECKGFTTDTVFLSAFIYALSRVGNYEDIVLNLIVNNRPATFGAEKQVGLYLNTIPFRYKFKKTSLINIDNLVQEINQSKARLLKIKQYPYLKLKQELKMDLHDFCFNYVHFHVLSKHVQDNKVSLAKFHEKTNMPCTLDVWRNLNQFSIKLDVNINKFLKSDIKQILEYTKYFLDALINHQCVIDKVIPEDLHNINNYGTILNKYSHAITLVQLLEQNRNLDSIAVVCGGKHLSYSELSSKINQLAHYMQAKGIVAESKVIILMERSIDMLIAIAGILKSGAAYVPIDHGYPNERIQYILNEITDTKFILTDNKNYTRCSKLAPDYIIVVLDSAKTQQNLSEFPTINPITKISSLNTAYIIYTSGSTGMPKGIVITHSAAVNYLRNAAQLGLVATSKIDFSTSIGFDLSVTSTLFPLVVGATIIIYQKNLEEIDSYITHLVQHSVDVVKLVPSYFSNISPMIGATSVTTIILGGEKTKNLHNFTNSKVKLVIDEYGPTETTVGVYARELYNKSKPVKFFRYKGAKFYVLDKSLSYVPLGTIGELYIGGECVARGYLKKPDLTAEYFLANPFEIGRLYKTGDLVRWLPDGNIEYIGRNDFQVKIRGYRIELGEIENALSSYSGIKQSVVLAKERKDINTEEATNNKYLVGYYVAEAKLNEENILSYLQTKLPEYMVPSVLIYLESLPLTINGKLDRKALPEPELTDNNTYLAPRNELERKVCQIWAQVLGLPEDKVSIRDDFFRLGGDSIIAIQLVSRLRQRLALNITVKDIFYYRAVEKLLSVISNISHKKLKEEEPPQGEFELLPIQQWFFANNFEEVNHWNQSFLVITPRLDIQRLQKAVAKLIVRHDAFRMRFYQGDRWGGYYAQEPKIRELKLLDIQSFGLTEDSTQFNARLDKELTNWQSDFNLEEGSHYRIGYIFGYRDGTARVYFAMHHLIVDTVSWRIIAEELHDLYHNKPLDIKSNNYKTWAAAIKEYSQNHQLELAYWQELLKDYKPLQGGVTHSTKEFELSHELTGKLIHECNKAYNTQINDLLLAALGLALQDVSGQNVNYVIMEGHGREELKLTTDQTLDVSRTVGWFTTMYPVHIVTSSEIAQSIMNIKEMLRTIPNKGIGYGALIGYLNKPNIVFNYLGQFDNLDQKLWRIVNSTAGRNIASINHSPYTLAIDAITIDGKMKFSIKGFLRDLNRFAQNLDLKLQNIIEHCIVQEHQYTPSDFFNVRNETDLTNLPLQHHSKSKYAWFEMTEIQKAYLLGRSNNYEVGNVSNHIYKEYYYKYIDVAKLENAINILVNKFDALRVVYSLTTLQQRFLKPQEVTEYIISVNDFSDNHLDEEVLKIIRDRLSHKLYDVSSFSLFAFEITKFKSCYVLHFSMDLILLDAQSRQLLFEMIDKIYHDPNSKIDLPEITFKDYQDYHKFLKQSSWYLQDKAYWQGRIPDMPTRPELPLKNSPFEIVKPVFVDHTLYIEKEIWQKFKIKADKYNVSYSSALLGLFGSVIAYFSGYKEFLITVTIFNRYAIHQDIEKILGDFTSTILFHYLDYGDNLKQSIKRSHELMWDNINHALFSGLEVQRELAKLQNLDNRKAVSPIVFTGAIGNKINLSESTVFLEKDEIISKRYWSGQTSQSWIDLQAVEVEDRFMSKWLYVSQLFEEQYIGNMNELYCNLIKYLATHDWELKTQLFKLPTLDQNLINAANSAAQKLTNDTIFARVSNNGAFLTDIAVIEELGAYTYERLKQDVSKIANYLLKMHPNSELVAIYSEKGYKQAVAALGIMQSGVGYLPLSYDWPLERIEEVLDGINTLLISQNISQDIRISLSSKYTLIVIDEVLSEPISTSLVMPQVTKKDIAYVIYTSGSTGKPKGVTITHESALNTIDAVNARFNVGKADKILALSDLSFDLSVYDIFGLLAVGGTVVFPKQDLVKDSYHWVDLINKHSITLWNSVPQLANILVEEGIAGSSLRLFLLSGDWVPIILPQQIKAQSPNAKVISLGGATEGSIWSIWYEIDSVLETWRSIPYGLAMPNQQIYILNANHGHCPINVIGQIYIGGLGIAKNYWNNQKLTEQSFIQHESLGRLYKTGDLGRWHQDGYVEYIGRADSQVKVHGYRIELEEIQHRLLEYPSIKQAIIISRTHNQEQNLIAYLVADQEIDMNAIADYLTQKLPEYMIPKFFMQIPEIPLTDNGKVAKDKLPNFEQPDTPKIMPRNSIENRIHGIWSDILNLQKHQVCVAEDFFRLGGNSISAIRLVSRINKELSGNTNVAAIYTNNTIEKLAKHLASLNVSSFIEEEGEI